MEVESAVGTCPKALLHWSIITMMTVNTEHSVASKYGYYGLQYPDITDMDTTHLFSIKIIDYKSISRFI